MNTVWQLQEAKNRLSELVECALHSGAQTITRHGKPVAVVISSDEYDLLRPKRKLVDLLRECPRPGLSAPNLDRSREVARDVAL